MEREILFSERKPRLAFRERRDHDSDVAIKAISGKRGSGSAVEQARSITIEDIWQELQGVRAKLEAANKQIAWFRKRFFGDSSENDLRQGFLPAKNIVAAQQLRTHVQKMEDC